MKMKIIFYLTVLFVFLACSRKSSLPGGTQPANTPATGIKSFLALGDSYTIGQGVEAGQRFPAQTVALLRQQGISISDPVYIAQTGWTTGNLQAAIAAQNLPSTYNVVTLLIGVNDQYQRMDTGGYAVRFTQLLQKAIQLAKGNKSGVFVLSIPDYSVTPFVSASEKERVRKEIDWFNAINQRITTTYDVSYTDITPSTREAANNPSLIARDGLHPSGTEYRKWADLLVPKMKAFLQ